MTVPTAKLVFSKAKVSPPQAIGAGIFVDGKLIAVLDIDDIRDAATILDRLEGQHPNCTAIDQFLTAIPSVNRPIAQTANVDEKPVANGYTASWHDQATNAGFTIIAMNEGELLLVIDGKGGHDITRGTFEDIDAFANRVNTAFFA